MRWRERLPFGRDRIVENYLWSVGQIHEPQFQYYRRMSTRISQLTTSLDDISRAPHKCRGGLGPGLQPRTHNWRGLKRGTLEKEKFYLQPPLFLFTATNKIFLDENPILPHSQYLSLSRAPPTPYTHSAQLTPPLYPQNY